MSNKIILVIVLMTLFFAIEKSFSQPTLTWTQVKIEGHGKIDLPSNMEIQAGQYREAMDKTKEIHGVSASKVIFQQSNLNSRSADGFKTYGRVLIRTVKENKGSFQKLNEAIYTASEISSINSQYKKEIYETAKSFNSEILEWTNAKMTKVNGMSCVTFGYSRKMGANPPVKITFYIFENYDRQHILTFEYRIKDELVWKPTFENILKSYSITKV
jgi:hypothetical protein